MRLLELLLPVVLLLRLGALCGRHSTCSYGWGRGVRRRLCSGGVREGGARLKALRAACGGDEQHSVRLLVVARVGCGYCGSSGSSSRCLAS